MEERVGRATGLARWFTDPARAQSILTRWGDDRLLEGIRECAAPDAVLGHLDRLVERRPELLAVLAQEPAWARRLIAVLAASDGLAAFLIRVPDVVDDLRADGPDHRDWVRTAGNADDLRIGFHRTLLQIAVDDVCHPEPSLVLPEVARRLADLADDVVATALRLAREEIGDAITRIAAIAMGKCGARELNYASDVDVIWVCATGPEQDPAQAVAAATRIAAAVARLCSAQTAQGTLWPIDANLRPEGVSGPLVRTLEAMETYYATWAQPWEFQALLKARPMAGDADLATRFVEMVAPSVWSTGDRPGFVVETQAMRRRVVSLLPDRERTREVKLGPGGLRDVEFTVQLLQLIHGRTDERLRSAGTLTALAELSAHGYVGRQAARQLDEEYRWQRVLEHRVQLLRLRRTHLVPQDAASLARLEGLLGVDDVMARWRESARTVLCLHQQLYYSPVLAAVAQVRSDDITATPEQAAVRLRALGFTDPGAALRHVEALTRGLSRKAEIQRALLPALLAWFAEGALPDAALLGFRRLSESLADSPWYLRALRDEGAMAQRLAHVLSGSRQLVDLLVREPSLVRLLVDEQGLAGFDPAEVEAEMRASVRRHEGEPEAVFSIRRREIARCAMADVLGLIDVRTVGERLSDVADLTLTVLAPEELGITAVGRWGGRELGYGSDLDVIFTGSDPDQVSQLRRIAAAAQPALHIDVDLRPEGRSGALVRSPEAVLAYYREWSSPWEAQALLRARTVTGQDWVGELDSLRHPADGIGAEALQEMRRLKARMETERMPRRVDPRMHAKLGPGGLIDVEWVAQLLQRQHAGTHPELRGTGTLDVLDAARDVGLLSAADADQLANAWLLASRVRNAIVLSSGRASEVLPTQAAELAHVASLVSHGPRTSSEFLEEWLRVRRHARLVAERLL